MTHQTMTALGLLLTLAGAPDVLGGQDTPVPAVQDIRLVRSSPVSPATAQLAGMWELRIRTPDRRLAAEVRLVQDSLFPCPMALMLQPRVDSGCLRGELPLEWIYVLGYAAGQFLHLVRVQDSVWAVVPGDGIISGISHTGDLSLVGVVRGSSVVGHWTQTRVPDSLHGTFTFQRKDRRP